MSYKTISFVKSKDKYKDFELTYIPNNTNLYQTIYINYDYEELKLKEYINNNNYGSYYLSTNKNSTIYNNINNFNNVIYTPIPLNEDILNDDQLYIFKPEIKYKYVYPLYYIDENKGIVIKYKLNRDLILLDIGNLKNIIYLWKLTKKIQHEDESGAAIKLLYKTVCISDDKDYNIYRNQPYKAYRNIKKNKELIYWFLALYVPCFKRFFDITLDGWIYKDEILLFNKSRNSLDFINKNKLPSNFYDNIPTLDKFKEMKDNIKVNHGEVDINRYNILHNYRN